jgi:hypothetical protein
VVTVAGDAEVKKRVDGVIQTARKRAEDNTWGWPTLSRLMGEPLIKQIYEWLGGSNAIHAGKEKSRLLRPGKYNIPVDIELAASIGLNEAIVL